MNKPKVKISEIKQIHDLTGVGLREAKKALETYGSFEVALKAMQAKGMSRAADRAGRQTQAGVIKSYVHDNRIGVLVEVNCETDFVARTDDFLAFVKDVALQIAASAPLYLSSEDVPQAALDHERDLLRQQAQQENLPADKLDMIVDGRLSKDMSEKCLLSQDFIKDNQQTMDDLLQAVRAKLVENITIKRFIRFELGKPQAEAFLNGQ